MYMFGRSLTSKIIVYNSYDAGIESKGHNNRRVFRYMKGEYISMSTRYKREKLSVISSI